MCTDGTECEKNPPRSSCMLWRATVYLGPREGLTRRTYVGLRAPPPPYDDGYRCRLVDIIACSKQPKASLRGCHKKKERQFHESGCRGTATTDLMAVNYLDLHTGVREISPSLRRPCRKKARRGHMLGHSRHTASHYSSRRGEGPGSKTSRCLNGPHAVESRHGMALLVTS